VDVVVAGSGPEGLACALALRAAGVSPRVAGPDPGTPDDVVELTANAVRALHALGLRDALAALGRVHDAREGRALGNGHRVAHGRRGALAAQRHGVEARLVGRRDLARLLADRAAAAGIAVDPDAPAARGDAAVLVAADGVDSPLRAAHFPDTDVQDAGLARIDAHLEAPLTDRPIVQDWRGGGVFATVSPPVDGAPARARVLLEARVGDDDAALDALTRALADAHGPVHAALGALVDPVVDRVRHMSSLPAWHSGRVILIGEAAHPVLPHLDQGLALALEDAWILGRLLEDADPAAPEPALQRLHDSRRARAAQVQKTAARLRAEAADLRPASPLSGLRRTLTTGIGSHLLPDLAMAGEDWLHGYDVHDPL
jgi:salicylate hydroxylase